MAARTATGDVAIADRKSKLIEAEDGKNPVQSPSQTLCLRASVRSLFVWQAKAVHRKSRDPMAIP